MPAPTSLLSQGCLSMAFPFDGIEHVVASTLPAWLFQRPRRFPAGLAERARYAAAYDALGRFGAAAVSQLAQQQPILQAAPQRFQAQGRQRPRVHQEPVAVAKVAAATRAFVERERISH